jgi:Tol biopolymer transport system component
MKNVESQPNIWMMPLKGGAAKQLTQNENRVGGAEWSPDGSQIAFVAENDEGNNAIYVMSAEGGDARLVVGKDDPSSPLWHPNGKELCYRNTTKEDKYQILKINLESGKSSLIVEEGEVFPNKYTPDGKMLIVSFFDGKGFSMGKIPANGGELVPIGQSDTWESFNDFDASGENIIFTSGVSGSSDIYMVPLSGGDIKKLTSTDGDEYSAQLSPDGKTMIYTMDNTKSAIEAVNLLAMVMER